MTPRPGGPRFLTTLAYRRRAAWMARAEIVEAAQLVRRAGRYEAVVLNGSRRVDQLAAAAIARRRRPPAVVLADATWKVGGGRLDRGARRAALRAVDHGRAHYCVLSSEEQRLFPRAWGVDPERVHFTPFHWVLADEELGVPGGGDGGGVFAGGNSLRDHGPLVVAAEGLGVPVTIASDRLPPGPLPSNVRAGPLPQARYDELFRRAAVVVVALERREDRSAGQQTYLNAMVLGKPVIVTDALGVRDHVVDGETGLIVPPGDARALRERLGWVLDPANADAVSALGDRARREAIARFGPDAYVERLIEVVDAALARPGA